MISIIIPTIGRANTFLNALESATACDSTCVDEILIADNSQSTEFAKLLETHNKLDQRINIIKYDERVNMATSWNIATSKIKNDWVIYLHDDDLLYSKNINIAAKYISPGIGFIYCDFDIDNNGKAAKWRYHDDDNLSNILTFCPRFVSTIINKHSLLSVGGWNEKNGYALDFVAFLLMAKNYSVIHGNCVLGLYRIHASNFSSRELRNKEYGDALGYVINLLFIEYKDEKTRRKILTLLIDFIYPFPNKIINRIFQKLQRTINYPIKKQAF